MVEALECPKCQSPLTSRLEVDGLQRYVHARCNGCGFELDLADREGSGLQGRDWVALALTVALLLGLATVASALEQSERMLADFESQLPRLTSLVLEYQLPIPFLISSGLAVAVGAVRRSQGQRGGAALLWVGCAVALVGLALCLAGLSLPMVEAARQIQVD